MWVQANLVNQILYQGLGLWAPLLYILSAIGGLVSLALGAPPKMYMWFFIGPGIYDWLLDNPNPVHGMEWRVADRPQNQREVWKLAESGLVNANPSSGISIYSDRPPSGTVDVPALFLWFDEIVSDVVQGMVGWTGIYNQAINTSGQNLQGNQSLTGGENKWYLLSNMKWDILENITNARLKSPDMRDAFVTFLASECGDQVKKTISQPRFIQASSTRALNLGPNPSVFENYNLLTQSLNSQTVPSPRSLKKILSDSNPGAFRNFHVFLSSGFINLWGVQDRITCDQYLWLMVQAFRWEAGHIFFQMTKAAPGGISPDNVVFSLIYGWHVDPNWWALPAQIQLIQRRFVIDLILLHLFRNELSIAPALVDQRFASSTQAESIAKGYQRGVGTKAKYAEVYTWAMLIPYLQGVLLYFLAIAYPFAAIMVVMPGMHKTMFTWMSFWAWVKLWDVGFALVMMMERSLWAMLGNSSNASAANKYILEMQTWGTVRVMCGNNENNLANCQIPSVVEAAASVPSWDNALRIFDRALVLGSNLDLDLQNSYYIYIMAALYFAVPTITGQLVLGARAGAASMVNSAIGGAAQEIGKTAGTAHQSDMITQMQANSGSVGQAAYLKQLRASGLGAKAIDYGNKGMAEEMASSALGTAMQNQGNYDNNLGYSRQQATAMSNLTQAGAGGLDRQASGNANARSAAAKAQREEERHQEMLAAQGAGRGAGRGGDPNGGGANPAITGAGPGGGGAASPPGPRALASGEAGAPQPAAPQGFNTDRPGMPTAGTPPVGGGSGGGGNVVAGGGGGGNTGEVQGSVGMFGQKLMNALGDNSGGISKFNEGNNFAVAAGEAKRASDLNSNLAASAAVRSGMGVASFGHGAQARGYNSASGKIGEYADFDANMGRWEAMNAYSSQITGMAAGVYGTFAGNFNPGPKPTGSMNAMAMDGLLNTKGTDARGAANYTADKDNGGYWSSAAATQSSLDKNYGEARTAGAYHHWGVADTLAYNWTAAGEMATGGVLAGGQSGQSRVVDQLRGGGIHAGESADPGKMGGLINSGNSTSVVGGVNPFPSGTAAAGVTSKIK
jgi:hypothetical protein